MIYNLFHLVNKLYKLEYELKKCSSFLFKQLIIIKNNSNKLFFNGGL